MTIYCIYFVQEIGSGHISRSYLERMNEAGVRSSLLPDHNAYITVHAEHYVIANSAGEVLFMGNDGIEGIECELRKLQPHQVFANGQEYAAFKMARSPLIYHIYIRKSQELGVAYVALQSERGGSVVNTRTYTGDLETVAKAVRKQLLRETEPYFIDYLNELYRLPGVQESDNVPASSFDGSILRDTLRAAVKEWRAGGAAA